METLVVRWQLVRIPILHDSASHNRLHNRPILHFPTNHVLLKRLQRTLLENGFVLLRTGIALGCQKPQINGVRSVKEQIYLQRSFVPSMYNV